MIYLDSSVVILAAENDGPDGGAVRQALADADTAELCVSPLVMMECLVKPIRDNNFAIQDYYGHFFDDVTQVALDKNTFLRAASLRALSGMGTQDAIHVAAAQVAQCEALWTADGRLARQLPGFVRNVLA